jgi:hypothetical protein
LSGSTIHPASQIHQTSARAGSFLAAFRGPSTLSSFLAQFNTQRTEGMFSLFFLL